MPSIFVTRELSAEHPWRRALLAEGYRVQAHSLLAFEEVAAGPIPPCDWVFAYSRNAVGFAAASLASTEARFRVAAMGSGTAAAWREAGYTVGFTGQGDPTTVARDLLAAVGAGSRVVFLQAANSLRSVEHSLEDRIVALPHIVYRSSIDPDRSAPAADVYLLTSPLNAEAALRDCPTTSTPTLLAIGPTTAAWCRDRGHRVTEWRAPPPGGQS